MADSIKVNLSSDGAGRAICGLSDGGVCSFNAAWHRPDAISRVISHIGSCARLHQGSDYAYLIRNTRRVSKPIRVFLQDGEYDINSTEGSWMLAKLAMPSALMDTRYDYRFVQGTGGHDLLHVGAILPDTLRWIWRDFPGVRRDPTRPTGEALLGTWEIVVNYFGDFRSSTLLIERSVDGLRGALNNDDGELEVLAIDFEDEVVSFTFVTSPSQKS